MSCTADRQGNDSPWPRITIALPTFARPQMTQIALRSALAQSYPAHEIIVSDDCPDDTIQRIVEAEHSERVVYVANRPALGIPKKINDLLQRATGDWIVYLGDDDAFDTELLARVADAIRADPDLVLVRSRARMIDDDGRPLGEDRVPDASLSPPEFLHEMYQYWYRMRVSITGFFFPVALMRRLGGFKPPCPDGFYYYDTVAWTTLALQGRTRLIGETLFTLSEIRVQMQSQRGIDGLALIDSRAEVARSIEQILNEAISAEADLKQKAALIAAQKHALRFIAVETRVSIRRAVTAAVLGARCAKAIAKVERLIDAALDTPQPHVKKLGLRVYLGIFRRIAGCPRPVRVITVRFANGLVSVMGRLQRGGRAMGPVGCVSSALMLPMALLEA